MISFSSEVLLQLYCDVGSCFCQQYHATKESVGMVSTVSDILARSSLHRHIVEIFLCDRSIFDPNVLHSVGNQEKLWAPYICFNVCKNQLL